MLKPLEWNKKTLVDLNRWFLDLPARVSQLTDDSRTFCWRMLEEAGVAITPGEDFGIFQANQHVRFSYAASLHDIRLGVDRVRAFLSHDNRE